MKKIYVIIGTLLLLVVLSGVFYWFQWRPDKIRRDCSKFPDIITTTSTSIDNTKDSIWGEGSNKNTKSSNLYTDCLHKNGLK